MKPCNGLDLLIDKLRKYLELNIKINYSKTSVIILTKRRDLPTADNYSYNDTLLLGLTMLKSST